MPLQYSLLPNLYYEVIVMFESKPVYEERYYANMVRDTLRRFNLYKTHPSLHFIAFKCSNNVFRCICVHNVYDADDLKKNIYTDNNFKYLPFYSIYFAMNYLNINAQIKILDGKVSKDRFVMEFDPIKTPTVSSITTLLAYADANFFQDLSMINKYLFSIPDELKKDVANELHGIFEYNTKKYGDIKIGRTPEIRALYVRYINEYYRKSDEVIGL